MEEIRRQYLMQEMEAAKIGLEAKAKELQKSLTQLLTMIQTPVEEWNFSHVMTWSHGHAAAKVAEIGSQLERIRTLHQAITLMSSDTSSDEQKEALREAWGHLKWMDELGILNQEDQPMMAAFRKHFEPESTSCA